MLKKISVKKITRFFLILLCISVSVNIFLGAIKHETNLEHSDYKILVQESAGSSNYVEYGGHTFPKRGYTLSTYTCDTSATITQNTITKALSFAGPANKCTLKFNITTITPSQTLQKLQELSGEWSVSDGSPDLDKTSPNQIYTASFASNFTQNNAGGGGGSSFIANDVIYSGLPSSITNKLTSSNPSSTGGVIKIQWIGKTMPT